MSKKKIFQLEKKEICITSSQIKQAIDLLVNENEILQDKVYKLEDVIKEVREYINENEDYFYNYPLVSREHLLEILDKADINV